MFDDFAFAAGSNTAASNVTHVMNITDVERPHYQQGPRIRQAAEGSH